ncbi:MAG: 50S ribosomal protein L24 [Candidatus Thermoplasmatota archaeon]|nr:50S ribosomal protein L24 [Euryarchaeota archaeon]MBU4031935.1 50S ribosomal protein L24 [Candidatus Thermoplasmatota archaeon]MBU4072477.1 50S ribosomal protein L24 [Candidatus Thermoplasmatota archaeon]MBU4144175.1 50S ribosomal protein L24 [Candidatus Thermoplasmatota archaeon]MBU4592809.1 50S ribosomal protein L24 [Candidatus Thermoplasmatota archaeon]
MPAKVSSKLPRKQRKGRYTATAHNRRKLISAHLCGDSGNDLIHQYNCRSLPVIKGDLVRVVRGDEKIRGKEAVVTSVFARNLTIGLDGINVKKADGTEVVRKISPSNVVIIKLNLSDPRRKKKLETLKEG